MIGPSLKYQIFVILFIGICQKAWANGNNWPWLDKILHQDICLEALKIANSTYHSNSFYLYDPPVIPQNANSSLVIRPPALNLSDADDLIIDKSVFKKISIKDNDCSYPHSIYWQIKTTYGLRFIMTRDTFS